LLARLREANAIPDVPIVVDSPMATSVTDLYATHRSWHRLDLSACRKAFDGVRYTQTADDSKLLDQGSKPMVLVSASGMATGGRVVHHLKRFAPEERNLILFAGYQAGGTRGATMVAGAEAVKIHGDMVPVRAEVRCLDMLSAHADANELLAWLRTERDVPRSTFVTHGEPTPSDTLRRRIQDELGWSVSVPGHGDVVEL
jgi:metallo-beta-lactamase family protein